MISSVNDFVLDHLNYNNIVDIANHVIKTYPSTQYKDKIEDKIGFIKYLHNDSNAVKDKLRDIIRLCCYIGGML